MTKPKRKCFTCRKPVVGSKMFCKDCVDKDRKTTAPTFVLAEKK